MYLLLFTLALLLLFSAGIGVVLLTTPRGRQLGGLECLSLAFLYGAGVVSLASFGLGWWLSGMALRLTVTLLCLSLGVAGIRRWRRERIKLVWPSPKGFGDCLLSCFLLLQVCLVFWLSLRTPLLWDGLLNWEIKARLAFQTGGRISPAYFTSSNLNWGWGHPEYPLLLPLTESWFYHWMGSAHQGMIKLIFPFFYLAALGLLAAGGARLGGRRWAAWLPPLLLFFIPLALIGEGSVASGYADFPLAVCYLAAAICLVEYWQSGETSALRLACGASAILPWIKQEGAILWLCVLGLTAVNAIRQKQWRGFLIVLLPGTIVAIGWLAFVRIIRAPLGQDYLPLTLSTLLSNLPRIPVILKALMKELVNWRHWSLLWPGLILALPLFGSARRRQSAAGLAMSAALPVICYLPTYLFFSEKGNTLNAHIEVTLPRLLIHVSLVAILLFGLALTERPDRREPYGSENPGVFTLIRNPTA